MSSMLPFSILIFAVKSQCPSPPANGTAYASNFQLLNNSNLMLITATEYNLGIDYCKIFNINEGTLSDVVSCDQNTREWSTSDIDPSATSIESAIDNKDGTLNIILRRNGANLNLTLPSYLQSGQTAVLLHDQFTVTSLFTTFIFIHGGYSWEVSRVTFKSTTDNSSPEIVNISLSGNWAKWDPRHTPNMISVYEESHAVQLPLLNECADDFIARYHFIYNATSRDINGIHLDTAIDGGKVDTSTQRAYEWEVYSDSITIHDLAESGGASHTYQLNLNYTTPTPTHQPTLKPTMIPSQEPTIYLTEYTSNEPTILPTDDPSQEPTMYPTQYPSIEPPMLNIPPEYPTNSPTQCVDFDEEYNSNDGTDDIYLMLPNMKLVTGNASYRDSHQVIVYDKKDGLSHESIIDCSNEDINQSSISIICVIDCGWYGDCYRTSIIPAVNSVISQLNLVCSGSISCDQMVIDIKPTVEVHKLSILCHSDSSCEDMEIDIASQSQTVLEIHCVEAYSCRAMQININDNTHINIVCYADNACDLVSIYTGNSTNFEITLQMHLYSEVFIDTACKSINQIQMDCHPNEKEHRYIQYPAGQLLSGEELESKIRNKYDFKQLPCDGIIAECRVDGTSDTILYGYEYEINRYFDVERLIENEDNNVCFWVDIFDIYSGNISRDHDEITEYNITFRSYITFNESYNDTDLFEICLAYFGESVDTVNTINNISSIYDNVLHIIKGYNSDGIIVNVSKVPASMLLDDSINNLDCTGLSQLRPLKLLTKVSIHSKYRNENHLFDYLFHPESEFIVISESLITALFDVPIELQIFPDADDAPHFTRDNIDMYIAIIVLASVLVLIVISFIVYLCKKKRIIKMRNPLVIGIAIGKYDDSKFKDLPVNLDIKHLEKFCKYFNYVFHLNGTNSKLYWTELDILEYLRKAAKHFAEYVISDDNHDKSRYDGLIVAFSGHGIQNYIISSDLKRINTRTIHRIFSTDYVSVRKVPRIFIFDACQGSGQRDTAHRSISDDEAVDNTKQIETQILAAAETKQTENNDYIGKNIDKPMHETQSTDDGIGTWYNGEDNPDHRLVTIFSANDGFQSFMGERGSFLTQLFVGKSISNHEQSGNYCSCDDKLVLKDTMDQIEDELHQRGIQLPTSIYQGQAERIFFMQNARVIPEKKEEPVVNAKIDLPGMDHSPKLSKYQRSNSVESDGSDIDQMYGTGNQRTASGHGMNQISLKDIQVLERIERQQSEEAEKMYEVNILYNNATAGADANVLYATDDGRNDSEPGEKEGLRRNVDEMEQVGISSAESRNSTFAPIESVNITTLNEHAKSIEMQDDEYYAMEELWNKEEQDTVGNV